MQYALVNNLKIEPAKGLKGTCLLCNKEVIAKCGIIIIHHWAHKNLKQCDNWWETETEWHREWKNKFPQEFREICFKDELTREIHRADIHNSKGITIEFQNSPMSTEELKSREVFYPKLLWVVNAKRFKIKFTHCIPDPENPLLNDFVFAGKCFFKKDEVAKKTGDEDRIYSLSNTELNNIEPSIKHWAFEWKNKHKIWLNSSVPTFLDLGHEYLYWLKERKQERCRFWYVEIIKRTNFISKYSV